MKRNKSTKVHTPLLIDKAPSDVFLNFEAFESNTETRLHSHDWGQIQLITGGILEMNAENTRFLAPPHLAIWVPAGVIHTSFNREPLAYCSINIPAQLTAKFPQHTSLVRVSAIAQAIVEDFRSRDIRAAVSAEDRRLIDVLIDQLSVEPQQEHFLPTSNNKYLQTILTKTEQNPLDNTSLSEWSSVVHTTERTLARYCQKELGMSFTEWRLRVRYLYSMKLLREGKSVKDVALTLGYKQASPFISMFKKYSGMTPEHYKKKLY